MSFRLYLLFIWKIGKVSLQYVLCFHSLYCVNDSSHKYRNYFFLAGVVAVGDVGCFLVFVILFLDSEKEYNVYKNQSVDEKYDLTQSASQ